MRRIPGKDERLNIYREIKEKPATYNETIRKLRRSTGKTQKEYAELIGLSTKILALIEQGKANPTVETINKIIRPFNLIITLARKN